MEKTYEELAKIWINNIEEDFQEFANIPESLRCQNFYDLAFDSVRKTYLPSTRMEEFLEKNIRKWRPISPVEQQKPKAAHSKTNFETESEFQRYYKMLQKKGRAKIINGKNGNVWFVWAGDRNTILASHGVEICEKCWGNTYDCKGTRVGIYCKSGGGYSIYNWYRDQETPEEKKKRTENYIPADIHLVRK